MDSSGSEEDPVAGSYGHGYEQINSRSSRVAESLLASQEELRNLVRHIKTWRAGVAQSV
jgi:hypothetical protein